MERKRIIEFRSVSAGYGKVQVLWELSLSLDQGCAAVLLGANGAGKTTLLKVLVGLLHPWSGKVMLFEQDVTHLPAAKRVKLGIGFMSEQGIFPSLSVAENFALGAGPVGKGEFRTALDRVLTLFPELKDRLKEQAGALSGGQRKMVGIAKCLMSNPRVLVMDEPSAGLSPRYVDEVVDNLAKLKEEGLSLFIAEQNVSFLRLAREACVIEGGRLAFSGPIEQFNDNEALHNAFFGLEGTAH